jgi:hypothetical protein
MICSEEPESNKTDKLGTSEEEESSRRSGKDAVSDVVIAVDEEDFARVDFALPP